MDSSILRWCSGLIVSLLIGHYAVKWLVKYLREGKTIWDFMQLPEKVTKETRITGRFFGHFERLVFTVMVGHPLIDDIGKTFVVMIAWIGGKMVLNWKHTYKWNLEHESCKLSRDEWILKLHMFARSSFVGNVMSISIATLGGSMCRAEFWC